ncbi:UNVERIFIED_CONTAM: Polygalacturonase [Sesamum calycinum]|uniref:Polygalacturonase n=1 Tax=Sesamum calycinum TaxID=2727403 RepID=A0AAW2RPH2_9LAMI
MMLILIFTFFYYTSSFASNPSYNVKSFGAISDGESDSTKAFLSAWFAACATTQPAAIYVPPGRYLLRNAFFNGKMCKNKAITIRIDGTLVAPSDYNTIGNSGTWLKFQKVTGVSISGGTLDGQGTKLWACKNSSKSCPKGATTLGFSNSKNVAISGLRSLNSQMFHIVINGCENVRLQGVNILASGDSPNTDGIHVQLSTGVTILNSKISTGDDCISIGPGAHQLVDRKCWLWPRPRH